jgi:hypothetical protein
MSRAMLSIYTNGDYLTRSGPSGSERSSSLDLPVGSGQRGFFQFDGPRNRGDQSAFV